MLCCALGIGADGMRNLTGLASALLLAAALSACALDPNVIVERDLTAYRADLAACRASVGEDIDRENAKTGPAWVSSPVRRPFQVRAGVRDCLGAKGYTVAG